MFGLKSGIDGKECSKRVEKEERIDLFWEIVADDGFFITIINYWKKNKFIKKLKSYKAGDDTYFLKDQNEFWDFMTNKEQAKFVELVSSVEEKIKYYEDSLFKGGSRNA